MNVFQRARTQIRELKEILFQIEAQAQKKKGNDVKLHAFIGGMLQPLASYVDLMAQDFVNKNSRIKDGMSQLETENEVAERMIEEFEKRRPS